MKPLKFNVILLLVRRFLLVKSEEQVAVRVDLQNRRVVYHRLHRLVGRLGLVKNTKPAVVADTVVHHLETAILHIGAKRVMHRTTVVRLIGIGHPAHNLRAAVTIRIVTTYDKLVAIFQL